MRRRGGGEGEEEAQVTSSCGNQGGERILIGKLGNGVQCFHLLGGTEEETDSSGELSGRHRSLGRECETKRKNEKIIITALSPSMPNINTPPNPESALVIMNAAKRFESDTSS